ncbi:MAG: hypothetical protein NTV86_17455, partial [Planctomycetota bacterium]|nr:hypothetical protein [Planctomycetota bacterium]
MYGYTTPLIYTFDWIADSTSINWLFGGSSGKAAGYDLFQLGQAAQLTTTHANTSTIDLGSSIALSTPVTDTTLTLGNSGAGTIAVSAPGISGGDAGLFSIIPATGTSLVGPAGT